MKTLTVYSEGVKLPFEVVIENPTPRQIRLSQNDLNNKLQKLARTEQTLKKGWILRVE